MLLISFSEILKFSIDKIFFIIIEIKVHLNHWKHQVPIFLTQLWFNDLLCCERYGLFGVYWSLENTSSFSQFLFYSQIFGLFVNCDYNHIDLFFQI